jgi:SAM-dependent methyltransferase
MALALVSPDPSKNLLRFADQIAAHSGGPVLDAPCGSGRNAIALAARGCTVVGIDINRKRLLETERLRASYIAHRTCPVTIGPILTICADLNPASWLFPPGSFAAIVCIHFPVTDLIPCFISSLRSTGHIYIETFGGHGENFRQLPKAGQVKELLSKHVEFKFYKERKVGPRAFNAVAVVLFAQKR